MGGLSEGADGNYLGVNIKKVGGGDRGDTKPTLGEIDTVLILRSVLVELGNVGEEV